MLTNSVFFFIIWSIKELHAHPMRLFMYIAACDQIVMQQYVLSLFTCNMHLQDIFAATAYFDMSCEARKRALELLYDSTMIITAFCAWCSMLLQICLCFDLILTMSRPFANKEARMPIYIGASVLIGILQCIFVPKAFRDMALLDFTKYNTLLIVLFCWIMAIASIIYGLCKLCKPSIAPRVRRLIIVRHITTIVFFFITQLYIQLGTLLLFVNIDDKDDFRSQGLSRV